MVVFSSCFYIHIICSISIFKPIPINMIPAHSSARMLMRLPHDVPMRHPMIENIKDTMPIMTIGNRIEAKVFMPTKTNEIPIAKASMLVATAKVSKAFFNHPDAKEEE